jgi:molybdopterin-synthase adenylyltransferase
VTPGRQCLQCLRQYDPSLVQTEREGLLEDPSYIEGLPQDHPLKARQNVFAFSMSCASMQMLQMLALVLSPLDQPNQGAQLYHFVGGFMEEPLFEGCNPECQFASLIATGDRSGVKATR